jgi:signal transduction histidine kinase
LYVLRLQLVLLKTTIADPNLLSSLATMKSSIDSIETMFEDILYMSLLESGNIIPEKVTLSMADLLQTISADFSNEAEKRGIRLRTFCSRDAHINADKQILKRILGNLVQNAVRHTESGGVLIACRRRRNGYRIDVIDSGFGIDKISQEKLFKPSERIAGSKTLDGNYGLGLSIVATLCKLINATIEVKSEPNKGSRFSIYLPY